jgi:hypothetical protein
MSAEVYFVCRKNTTFIEFIQGNSNISDPHHIPFSEVQEGAIEILLRKQADYASSIEKWGCIEWLKYIIEQISNYQYPCRYYANKCQYQRKLQNFFKNNHFGKRKPYHGHHKSQ